MNTKELKYFLEVCHAGNIKNAAEKLYITPQGLSKVMRNLEMELGVMLLIRSNNGIILTDCGELLKKKAGHMIQEMEDMLCDMEQMKNDPNKIRLACSYAVLGAISPDFILDYMKKNPGIVVEWKEYNDAQVEDAVGRNQADYGLMTGKVNAHIFEEKLLCTYPISLQVYKGHPLFDVSEITFSMLDSQDVISGNRDSNIYQDFMQRCQKAKAAPNMKFETTDQSFARQLCSQGLGVVVAADYTKTDSFADNIRRIPFADREFEWQVYMIRKKDIKVPSVFREFEKFILDLTCL